MYYPNCTCPDGSTPDKEPVKPEMSYIRFLNAIPNQPEIVIDIYVNRKLVVKNLKYEDFTEYIPAKSGVYNVQIYPAGNHTEQLLDIKIKTEPDKIYTAAIIGTINNVELEVFEDKYLEDSASNAYMRFANLSPDSPGLNIFIDDVPVVYDLQYLEVTDYLKLSDGKHTMKVERADNNERVISHPNMVLKNGYIYTSYMVGLVNDKPFIQVLIPLDGSSYIKTDEQY